MFCGGQPIFHVLSEREYLIADCAQVPSLFQDNFDYSDIRKDFVHGILTSDLLQKNIYCYVAKEGYAARVKDTRSYDSIRLTNSPTFAVNVLTSPLLQQGHLVTMDVSISTRR